MLTNRMPSGEKAINRIGPMGSGVKREIRNPPGRLSGKLVSFTASDSCVGVGSGVGPGGNVAVGDGTRVGVRAAVGVPFGVAGVTPVSVGCGIGVGDGASVGVGIFSGVAIGTCSEIVVGERIIVCWGVRVDWEAGVGNWTGLVKGTDSRVAAGGRSTVGSGSPHATRRRIIAIGSNNPSPIRNTSCLHSLVALC